MGGAIDRDQAKQEAELSVAPRPLEQVRPLLRGRVVSGDGLYGKLLGRMNRANIHLLAKRGGTESVVLYHA